MAIELLTFPGGEPIPRGMNHEVFIGRLCARDGWQGLSPGEYRIGGEGEKATLVVHKDGTGTLDGERVGRTNEVVAVKGEYDEGRTRVFGIVLWTPAPR